MAGMRHNLHQQSVQAEFANTNSSIRTLRDETSSGVNDVKQLVSDATTEMADI